MILSLLASWGSSVLFAGRTRGDGGNARNWLLLFGEWLRSRSSRFLGGGPARARPALVTSCTSSSSSTRSSAISHRDGARGQRLSFPGFRDVRAGVARRRGATSSAGDLSRPLIRIAIGRSPPPVRPGVRESGSRGDRRVPRTVCCLLRTGADRRCRFETTCSATAARRSTDTGPPGIFPACGARSCVPPFAPADRTVP